MKKSLVMTLVVGLSGILLLQTSAALAERVSLSGLQQQIDGLQVQIDNLTTRVESLEGGGMPAPQQNLIVVALDGSGDYTDPLVAVNDITDASPDNLYVVRIMPGVYDIGTQILQMKPYVNLEGSGRATTKVEGNIQGTWTGVLHGASNAELRSLTVENTGGASSATAIYAEDVTSFVITDVTAIASSGDDSSHGILCYHSSVTMTDVIAHASNNTGSPNSSAGIFNETGSATMTNIIATGSNGGVVNGTSTITMTNVTATALDGGSGVANGNCMVTMTNITAAASGDRTYVMGVNNGNCPSVSMINVTATASGTGSAERVYGVRNFAAGGSSTSVTMTNVTATATGGSLFNHGVSNDGIGATVTMVDVTATGNMGSLAYGVKNDWASLVQMTRVTASASNGSSASYGTYGVRGNVQINDSQISGSDYSLYSSQAIFIVQNTRLEGPVYPPDDFTCVDVYDFSNNPLDANCQ